jgi:hypothetical protein
MSRKNRTTLTAVERLVDQRRQYQEWLAKLDATPGDMPAHVVERVRNDYQSRLASVVGELAEHQDALREALAEAQVRYDGLLGDQQKLRDELAELKLRRQVGELDEERFSEQSGELRQRLDLAVKEGTAALRDRERFEEILEAITAAEPQPESVPEPEPVPEPELQPAPEPAAPPPDEEVGEITIPFAEPEPSPPPAPAPRRSIPAQPAVKAEDELEFLRSVTSTVAPARTPRTRAAPRGGGNPPPPPPAPEPRAEPAPAPPAEKRVEVAAAAHLVDLGPAEEEPAPAAEGAPAADEAKTLVCGECGALNRPTEWYCEKCGAELSSF